MLNLLKTDRKDTTFLQNPPFVLRGEIREFNHAIVMGILNLTPDSFYDGGKSNAMLPAMKKAEEMIHQGADIVDLGAFSSRPGAAMISEEEERSRLIPVLKSIRKEFPKILLSVDTFRSDLAKEAVELGADLINDISGGELDEKMMPVMAELKVPYILMHMRGNPQTMQQNLHYENVVDEVYKYFSSRLIKAAEMGISDVILDPGFGFGKSLEDNYKLMHAIPEFKKFNTKILVGISRKSMVGKVTGTSPDKSLAGTISLNTIALLKGADILRVHDVKEAKDAVQIVSYYQNI